MSGNRAYRDSWKKPQELKAILFDLDGTLCEVHSRKGILENICRKMNIPAISRDEYLRAYGKVIQKGVIDSRYEIFKTILEKRGIFNPSLIKNVSEEYSKQVLNLNYLKNGAVELLNSLMGKFKLGLITNGPARVQKEKINKLDIQKYFDIILISGEIGVAKPNPEIFKLALKNLKVHPENAIFVGDSYEYDIVGAKRIGMKTVLISDSNTDKFFPNKEVTLDYHVSSLGDLKKIIFD
jgi:HAD superfamily hydrolase (TIGR02253 family)